MFVYATALMPLSFAPPLAGAVPPLFYPPSWTIRIPIALSALRYDPARYGYTRYNKKNKEVNKDAKGTKI